MFLNKDIINKINNFLVGNIKPGKIFLNLVNKKNLINRLNQRKNKNRYDRFKYSFYRKVQNGFLNIAKKKNNYMLVNSDLDINENKKKILKKVKSIIK